MTSTVTNDMTALPTVSSFAMIVSAVSANAWENISSSSSE